MMTKTAFIVGAGFSAALTSGKNALIGAASLPTLANLGHELLNHISNQLSNNPNAFSSFSAQTQNEGLRALSDYFSRDSKKQYDFEQFISLIAFRTSLFKTNLRDDFPDLPGTDPSTLRFILHGLYDYFATTLSYNGKATAQRNFIYKVNNTSCATALQKHFQRIRISGKATFISFNYDGLLEAFLNSPFGKPLDAHPYWLEMSHGIPIVKPEHLVKTDQFTVNGKIISPTRVIKPHGSMHFFPVREEMRSILGGPSMVALSPILDIGFDQNTMQRDINELHAWQYISSTPMIVPPVMNKDSYLTSDYFREMLRLTYKAVSEADQVVVLGFSLPPSDLHISAVFESINWDKKRVVVCYRGGRDDKTFENWNRVLGNATFNVLTDSGFDFSTPEVIDKFWSAIS
jgi:hypothetical protein